MFKPLFIFLFFTQLAFGQDSSATRNKEFYLTLADFSPLNIHLKYKQQIREKTYLKFGLVNLSVYSSNYKSDNTTSPFRTFSYSGGLQMGIEFRKSLSDKFTIFHGPNIAYYYQKDKGTASPENIAKQQIHTVSVPYSFGVLFNLTPNLLLAAEINPSINFSNIELEQKLPGVPGISNKINQNNVGFSMDNRSGLISLVLRF